MFDITKTRSQLKEEAALTIGIIEPGETLSAEDDDAFERVIDPLIAQLLQEQIVWIDDTNAIDVTYFLPLARLLGNMAGPRFGSPINQDAKKLDEQELRRLTATRPTYAVTGSESNYF